jgi:hypothetical protein
MSLVDKYSITPSQLRDQYGTFECIIKNDEVVNQFQAFSNNIAWISESAIGGPEQSLNLTVMSTVGHGTHSSNIMQYWQTWRYAYRDTNSQEIYTQLVIFMQRLADAITARYPLFACHVAPVGSSYERTKIDYPDEFNMNFVLTRFSSLYEAISSPGCPPGFVHLKRKEVSILGQLHLQSNYIFSQLCS